MKLSWQRYLRDERGQTSIFVALVFQVLFVFFAMAINIGMVVHDKINLQNAVDLSAYYAAQRQAEWLNVIAHTNYQIRQALKLFAFRYKVMGSMGMDGGGGANPVPLHPALDSGNPMQEELWDYAKGPAGCISHNGLWDTVQQRDNICRQVQNPIPALPQIQVVASFNPVNMAIAALTAQIQQRLNSNCAIAGAYSWYWSAAAAQAYRSDMHNRIMAIKEYARILALGDPWDINGAKISLGAKNTFQKNLTASNRSGVQQFRMYNSLKDLTMEAWLAKILIQPSVWYIDVKKPGGSCVGFLSDIVNEPVEQEGKDAIKNILKAEALVEWMDSMNSFITGSDYSYSLGVEKNPWVMAYMGVEAKTISRPVFFPFGSGVELTARAFAKPFGGRIGPWYASTWPRSSDISTGERVDNVVPSRLNPAGGFLDSSDETRLPDHAKYPGDELGIKSYMALNALREIGRKKYEIHTFSDVWKNIEVGAPEASDRLAWDHEKNEAPLVRNYEIAAVAPDLFDITYYSIEPNFYTNYLSKIDAVKNRIFENTNILLRADLGSRPGTALEGFSVQQQIETAEANDSRIPGAPRKSEVFYFVRDKTDLLTAWMSGPNHGQPGNYSQIFDDYFGECELKDDEAEFKAPGSCIARGGRTGYSVKIISKEALLSDQWKIGGGDEVGAIKNPPTEDKWESF